MKKIVFLLLTLLILGSLFWWGVKRSAPSVKTEPRLVVSGYVPYTLAKQIAGDSAEILMLLPPGAEPHSFEPTPGVLIALNQADAFIYISDELEPWAKELAQTVGARTQVLALAKSFPTVQDPHVWMNIQQAQLMAYQIAALLAKIAPQNRAVTDENYFKLASELDDLQTQFSQALATCKYHEVVHIGHLAFGNLLQPYGLTLTALSGTAHEGEHSVKKLTELIREIKDKQLPAIFTEESVSPGLSRTVATETGVQILPLYSIEHISKQDFENQVTYAELMRRNLQSLTRGLICQAS